MSGWSWFVFVALFCWIVVSWEYRAYGLSVWLMWIACSFLAVHLIHALYTSRSVKDNKG